MNNIINEIDLCYGKLTKANNYSWSEIKEMCNFPLGESHLKNLAYGYKRLIESGYLYNDSQYFIDEKIEKIKNRTINNETNRELLKKARHELLYELIASKIEALPLPSFIKTVLPENEKAYILHLSDIHYGSVFNVEGNSYSISICEDRFNKLFNEVINKIETQKINKLIIVNTGDSIQGMLRISDVKKNEIPVVESVVGFSKLMASFLNSLSSYTNIEYYHVSSANHSEPRFIGTSAGQMPEEDMEKIIINYINDLLINNERIYVHTDLSKPYIELNVNGFELIAMHGHTIRKIENAIRDLSMINKKFYNFLLLGHFHHFMEKQVDSGCEVLMTGSFVGQCAYSKKLLKSSEPIVKMYCFEKEKGHTESYNFFIK